ncbi:hypothetical protein FRC08_009198 [Ceratobasidium sp. 394]|nr:hypothetical protein FRC08_009198 [Ceratobasidium sp. 394]
MLTAASLGIPCILQSDIHVDEDAMAKGGYADVFRGDLTLNGKPSPIQVAVKKVRIRLYGEATRTLVEKKQQQLARELRIWNKLQRFSDPHPHLLALLGVIEAPGGLLDSVSEYCTGTLASHLQNHNNRPRRIDLASSILQQHRFRSIIPLGYPM